MSEKRIPRPPNAFMLFGQNNRRTVAQQYPTYTNKQISKILGDKWRNMDPAEKDSYHRLANEAHANHMKKYPGYYYSPLEARQRKAERKRKYMQKMTVRRNTSENVMSLPNISRCSCTSSNPHIDSMTISDYNGLFGDHCYAALIEPDQSHHHQPQAAPQPGSTASQLQQQQQQQHQHQHQQQPPPPPPLNPEQSQIQPQADLMDFETLDKLIGNANWDNWNFLVDFKF